LPDADEAAVTPPSEDDSSHAKKSLFETTLPTADTTSDSYHERVKQDTADDGVMEENGKHLNNKGKGKGSV